MGSYPETRVVHFLRVNWIVFNSPGGLIGVAPGSIPLKRSPAEAAKLYSVMYYSTRSLLRGCRNCGCN